MGLLQKAFWGNEEPCGYAKALRVAFYARFSSSASNKVSN